MGALLVPDSVYKMGGIGTFLKFFAIPAPQFVIDDVILSSFKPIALSRGLCALGWHIPWNSEWVIDHFYGILSASNVMKLVILSSADHKHVNGSMG